MTVLVNRAGVSATSWRGGGGHYLFSNSEALLKFCKLGGSGSLWFGGWGGGWVSTFCTRMDYRERLTVISW